MLLLCLLFQISLSAILPVCNKNQNTCKNPLLSTYTLYAGQYQLPSTLLQHYWSERMYRRKLLKRSTASGFQSKDKFRLYIYQLLEGFFNYLTNSSNGHQCLLRLICENTQILWQQNLHTKILKLILEVYVFNKTVYFFQHFIHLK